MCLPRSFPRDVTCSFTVLLVRSLLTILPDQLNGSTNGSTFSIIVSMPMVGQIYRATSANTINFISIISFHICCCSFSQLLCELFSFSFALIFPVPLKSSSVRCYNSTVCFFRIFFLLLRLLETNVLFNIIFAICHRVDCVLCKRTTVYKYHALLCIQKYVCHTLSLLSSK